MIAVSLDEILEKAEQKREVFEKLATQVPADVAKYQKIVNNKYAQDLKDSAWDALIGAYPDAKEVAPHDLDGFLKIFGLELNQGIAVEASIAKVMEWGA